MQGSAISIWTSRIWLTLAGFLACCALAHAVTPMVSLGQDHGLALRSDGTVLAWGSDTQGQLGLSRPLLSNLPVKVAGLSNVRAIGSGPGQSLAVRQDGTVWVWGQNNRGQLGDGTSADQSTPVQVPGVTHAVMACGGWYHGAALLADGSVWTWGTNMDGQLGNGKSGEFWATVPGPVTALGNATAIACTGAQTFALLRDETVRAWGGNANGDLGDGTTTDRTLPVPVSGLNQVVAINGKAALKRDGSVWEWGITTCCGQTIPNLVPVQSAGVGSVVSISTGSNNVFNARIAAIKSDGVTWWRWIPGSAPELQTPAGNLTALAATDGHTLLLKADGSVLSAGANHLGQLGNGTTASSAFDPQSSFLPVVGLSNIAAVAVGERHSLALDAGGNVWAWGDDGNGQLGRGAALAATVATVVPGLSKIVQVSAGWQTSGAVDQSGNVWTWGSNYTGQLGFTTAANSSAPLRVPGVQDVQMLLVGTGAFNPTSYALKRDGSVWAWGQSPCATPENNATGGVSSIPAPIPGLTQVNQISAYGNLLAVKHDGTVWACGHSDEGALGLGATKSSAEPAQIPGLAGVRSLAMGGGHSFAVKADGTVMAWGTGALGNDSGWSQQLSPTPVPSLDNVVDMATSVYHTLARRSDGAVWGWAGNGGGGSELGSRWSSNPGPITAPAPIQVVSAGSRTSALLGGDGILYMGGDNSMGVLADGTFAHHPDFVLAVNPTLDGYLNLASTASVKTPAALQTPFFVASSGGVASSSASVSTVTKFNPADSGKRGAVFITASVPSNSTLALSAKSPSAAIGPHPSKAAAADASAFTLLQLTPTGWQTVTNGQLLAYSSGVLGDQLAAQTILNNTDTSTLKGAEFCVGYGTSAADMLGSGNIRSVATIPGGAASTSCVVGGTLSVALSVVPGWNLLGNPVNQSIAVADSFGDAAKVNSVWKWDSTAAKWQFYAPNLGATELQSYAASQGFAVLREIAAGDGFWVNAKTQAELGTLTGAAINLRQSSLSTGWNLVSTASAITPQDFNLSLSTTPPTAGQVPVNMTSLWAWDSAQSQWYFYAPSLDNAALAQFNAERSYRDFGTNSKSLGSATGFWVKRP